MPSTRHVRCRRVVAVAIGVVWVLMLPRGGPTPAFQDRPLDLVITGGTIIDGTGASARPGDLGVRDGRIVLLAPRGGLAATPAAERIDASGLVVAPGFIDVHTHADDIAERPLAENFLRMGVTSIVAGNCGSSTADVAGALQRIDDVRISVNFATLIGHNTVRAAVMGRAERSARVSELEQMKALVFKAMAEGAIGFSTGLQYVPGVYAGPVEVVELARVAANRHGVYTTHLRNEGTDLLSALREAVGVVQFLDMPLQISHLKVDSPRHWGASAEALAYLDSVRARGVDVQADQYAYTAGASTLSIRFPPWVLEGGVDAIRTRLTDPETWTRTKREMLSLLEARGFHDLSWATVASYPADRSLDGLAMPEVATRFSGRSDADAQLEAARTLMLGGGASMVYHFMDDGDVERIMRDPFVSVASDASVARFGQGAPHPRGYGNTARVLGEYVRRRGVLTLEEAIRKMTSLPARHFRLTDRGEIRVGGWADLTIFHPDTVDDQSTYSRPHAYPTGIAHVIVNGVPAVDSAGHTGARSGAVLFGHEGR